MKGERENKNLARVIGDAEVWGQGIETGTEDTEVLEEDRDRDDERWWEFDHYYAIENPGFMSVIRREGRKTPNPNRFQNSFCLRGILLLLGKDT